MEPTARHSLLAHDHCFLPSFFYSVHQQAFIEHLLAARQIKWNVAILFPLVAHNSVAPWVAVLSPFGVFTPAALGLP